jgi:HKD family nuclease
MLQDQEKRFPLFDSGGNEQSLLFGAPQNYDLLAAIRASKRLRIAIAFGHMSGWNKIEAAVLSSKGKTVEIILGQAFFQTEPNLLLLLEGKMMTNPNLFVRLAPVQNTFHPKIWLLHGAITEAVVGSANLSKGGFSRNVELALYTNSAASIVQIKSWFTKTWDISLPLQSCIEEYIEAYESLSRSRKTFSTKLKKAKLDLVEKVERKSEAILRARRFWKSKEGKLEIAHREEALQIMRDVLHFPKFNFTTNDWEAFLRITAFGRIRLSRNQKTLSSFRSLKTALSKAAKGGPKGLDDLMAIPGIGRNIASKLMVVCNPTINAVVNTPVLDALRFFEIETKDFESLSSQS